LSAHQHAEMAARAAVAAAKQGKFWPLHRALFENQEKGLSRETIEKLAAEAGLDMKRFRQDLESEAAAREQRSQAGGKARAQRNADDLRQRPPLRPRALQSA
jgi:predicted DsbA family dithiol-disulfide isomerase